MDKQKVIDAIELADKVCEEKKLITSTSLAKEDDIKVISLAIGIMIADAIRESSPLPYTIGKHRVGVDMGVKDGDMAEFTHDFDKLNWLPEPTGVGYWYCRFNNGSVRLAEVEEADSGIDGVRFRVMLLDHSGESVNIRKEKAEWLEIHPQL